MVSGTISLSSSEYFSPFPRGTSSLSVAKEYLALGDGPPGFPQNSSCSVVLGCPTRSLISFVYEAITLCGSSFQMTQLDIRFLTSLLFCRTARWIPQPRTDNACKLSRLLGLGSSQFARRYYGNRVCFLFLGVLRWFSSPGCPPSPMNSVTDNGYPFGFPIRESPDQSVLATPRSLSQLTTPFIVSWRQGIHHLPLVAWPLF